MKKSNKNGFNNIWQLILILVEVAVLCAMVTLLFVKSWQTRPEKSKVESFVASYSKAEPQPHYSNPVVDQKSKDIPRQPTFEEVVASYVFDICEDYPAVDPYLVLSVIFQESRFKPNVSNGGCVGLMQISTYWHRDRADRLGVTDFLDPYSNVLLGVDLLNELLTRTKCDIYYALMLYNQTYESAHRMYSQGIVSDYAIDVVSRAQSYKEGYLYGPT